MLGCNLCKQIVLLPVILLQYMNLNAVQVADYGWDSPLYSVKFIVFVNGSNFCQK